MEQNIVKRSFFYIIYLGFYLHTTAQQTLNIDRYQTQMPMVNPALSGMWVNDLAIGARWSTGTLVQPVMPIIRVDWYSPVHHSGFGLSLTGSANRYGFTNVYVKGNYNYQVHLPGDAKVSLGVNMQYGHIRTIARDIGELTAGFGAAYSAKTWHFGFAAQQLIPVFNQSVKRRQNPCYIATANYILAFSKNMSISPEGLFGYDEKLSATFFSIGAKFTYNQAYIGMYYLKDATLYTDAMAKRACFSVGVVLLKFIQIDYTLSGRDLANETRSTLTLRMFLNPQL